MGRIWEELRRETITRIYIMKKNYLKYLKVEKKKSQGCRQKEITKL